MQRIHLKQNTIKVPGQKEFWSQKDKFMNKCTMESTSLAVTILFSDLMS